jgi:hypothetical protein
LSSGKRAAEIKRRCQAKQRFIMSVQKGNMAPLWRRHGIRIPRFTICYCAIGARCTYNTYITSGCDLCQGHSLQSCSRTSPPFLDFCECAVFGQWAERRGIAWKDVAASECFNDDGHGKQSFGQEFAPVPPNKQFIHLLPLFNIIEQLQDAIVKSF